MPSSNRTVAAAVRSAATKVFAGLLALALGVLGTLLLASSASAASTTDAQLTLSGVATSDSPTGGDTVGIHPGDSVKISASTAPTAGLQKLGMSDVLGGLLNGIAGYQVKADLSKLPGGSANTVLKSGQSKTFAFSKVGTYTFTWTAQRVNVLGGLVPIDLDGNQLKKAGAELNAKNQYVGKIVVAKNPPKGGISVQVPGTSVQPKVGGVQLPKVTLPGVTTPSISTDVPSLNTNPGKSSGSKPTKSKTGKSGTQSAGSKSSTNTYSVPDLVVPQGNGVVSGSSSGYEFDPTSATSDGTFSFTNGSFGQAAASGRSTAIGKTSSTDTAPSSSAGGTQNDASTANASRPAATSGMPVILAVIAVVALVLVAGTYARLFLLGNAGDGASKSS